MTLGVLPRATVNRLRVRGHGVDPIAARGQAGWVLDESSLHPAALAPAAILCIRRVVDPRPGQVRFEAGRRPPEEWTRAVADSIADLARRAHPARGHVPASADVVVFADRAELLACLAEDWCAGELIARWWWAALLRNVPDVRAVVELWRASPGDIAAALELLVERRAAAPFVARLQGADAIALARVIAGAHAMRELARVLELANHAAEPVLGRETVRLGHRGGEAGRRRRAAVAAPSPWAEVAPEADADGPGPMARLLLGIALSVRRAPELARAPRFAARVGDWLEGRASEREARASGAPAESLRPAAAVRPVARVEPGAGPRETNGPAGGHVRPDVVGRSAGELPSGQTVSLEAPAQSVAALASRRAPAAAAPLESRYGGVLCLLNLGIYLGLYGDFTAPLRPGIPLSIWDYIALVGRHLAGRRLCRDPLWTLAARLAGRDPRTAPGAGLEPGHGVDLARLREEAAARLARALGTRTRAGTSRLLCARRCRVHVTPSHLDAVFPLASLPIEVRLSGLDRNPGWIPAAGRVVTFHYE